VNGGIAAYIYVVPNGKLCGGQQAKHLQSLKEAVAGDGLRLSHAPLRRLHTRCISIAHIVEIRAGSARRKAVVGIQPMIRAGRLYGMHSPRWISVNSEHSLATATC
jgi:hypothetical protein